MRQTTTSRQLGRALSVIALQSAREQAMHADVSAYSAPIECHALVASGAVARARQARRLAKAVSGLSRTAFNRELRRAPFRAMLRAEDRACARFMGQG